MEKRAHSVIVKTTEDGSIHIEQEDPLQQDSAIVVISPDQVDMLVAWLLEAKLELTARD